MGIRGNVTRTNLAYANEHRDWRVYENLAQLLNRKTRPLYAEDATGLDLSEMVYAVDASTIDLCLSLFPWATFKSTKAAVKLHTMIDLHGSIPLFITITEGNVHDVNGKWLVFLTNNFTLSAPTIAAIYKRRWQIELFFKWIKQNLRAPLKRRHRTPPFLNCGLKLFSPL